MNVRFGPNPDFERDLERVVQASPQVQQVAQNIVAMLENFQAGYAGQDVAVVKPALATAWASTNPGASIGEPARSQVAQAIADRYRVWIDERRHIMVDDGED